MDIPDPEICPDCDQKAIGSITFHELYCYDCYVVSAPHPQNSKQRQVDTDINERIVKPLEQCGFKCYLGSRNTSGGDFVLQSLSNPITVIPTTIVPVYRDRFFTTFRNLLIRLDYLDRIVFLCYDSTRIEPLAVYQNSFSISINDPNLLHRLIQTIERKRQQIPLSFRKRQYEKMSNGPESTVSSTISDFHRNIPFRRTDPFRLSMRRPQTISEAPEPPDFVEMLISNEDVSIASTSKLVSLDELLNRCYNSNEAIRNCAATLLRKRIQENIVNLCSDDGIQFETFEKCTRSLVEKYDSIIYIKLYFWILVIIFLRIYKYDDLYLKRYIKILTLPHCKISRNPFERPCQQMYLNLASSLHTKMKIKNLKNIVQKLENCLSMIDIKSDNQREPPDELVKILTGLPWDMTHIFIVAIAVKLFKKGYTPSNVYFFSEICDLIERKHWGVFIDVLERLTLYTLDHRAEGSLKACMDLLNVIVIWTLQKGRKTDQLNAVVKNYLSKLVYHPVKVVSHCVTPLLLEKDFKSFDISQLGNSFVKVSDTLVDKCIREHLHHQFPDLILNSEIPTQSLYVSIYEAGTTDGDALVYVFKQRTLNDILQTNSTDDAYQRFSEFSRLVQACQVHKNIVTLRNLPENSKLPFVVVEYGEPLLNFLHAKENQLTWGQMIQILIDITTAIDHCHRNNIILCDITPASFIIVTIEGSFKIKLANFLHARRAECLDSSNPVGEYIEDIDFHCIQGDTKEHLAAYFTSPESLSNKTFSKKTEVWMLAATFYSVLLYGRQPFEELAHLNVSDFVKEITSHHTARTPVSIPSDLWNIVKTNLDFCVRNRSPTEKVLQELETYKRNLGAKSQAFYTVTSVSSYINPEDIQRGYVNDTGKFVMEQLEEPLDGEFVDSIKLGPNLIQTVTVRMSLNTKRKILQLNHENILKVIEIKTDCYKTILVSDAFKGHRSAFIVLTEDISKDQLFSYLKQMTLGLQELHRHNIVHCDLRCKHIYINPDQGTLKIGHFGRAVSLNDTSACAIKLMPAHAKKWSAPEVRKNGMYSKASDIFNLAALFWEAISVTINTIYQNHPLEPFQYCRIHLEEYYYSVNSQSECQEPVFKLVKIILKCWNPNPTKRPTLDMILEAIDDLMTYNVQYCLTAEDTIYEDRIYETIIDSTFSIKNAWGIVVNEFVDCHGLSKDAKAFIEVREMPLYVDIGLPQRKKRQSKRGIIL